MVHNDKKQSIDRKTERQKERKTDLQLENAEPF